MVGPSRHVNTQLTLVTAEEEKVAEGLRASEKIHNMCPVARERVPKGEDEKGFLQRARGLRGQGK